MKYNGVITQNIGLAASGFLNFAKNIFEQDMKIYLFLIIFWLENNVVLKGEALWQPIDNMVEQVFLSRARLALVTNWYLTHLSHCYHRKQLYRHTSQNQQCWQLADAISTIPTSMGTFYFVHPTNWFMSRCPPTIARIHD